MSDINIVHSQNVYEIAYLDEGESVSPVKATFRCSLQNGIRTSRRRSLSVAVINRRMQLDREFKTFSDSCIYPDHPRIRAAEHFLNLPRDSKGLTSDECPLADACVLTAILYDFKKLQAKEQTDASKLVALKSLGHWSVIFINRCTSLSSMTKAATPSGPAGSVRATFTPSGTLASFNMRLASIVCTENLIRVYQVTESAKLAQW